MDKQEQLYAILAKKAAAMRSIVSMERLMAATNSMLISDIQALEALEAQYDKLDDEDYALRAELGLD